MKIGPAALSLVEPPVLNTKIDLKYKRQKMVEMRARAMQWSIKIAIELTAQVSLDFL